MTNHVVLFRGINVGGKNMVPMSELGQLLKEMGFGNVATHIQSGNVILRSQLAEDALARTIEKKLGAAFKLDGSAVKVLALTGKRFQAIVDDRPAGFGDVPDMYHCDAIFLMGITAGEALPAFSPLDGVDTIWPGDGVIYSQRLSARRTKSRLNRMMASPLYKSMTIRSWGTTMKLLEMVRQQTGGAS
ncbi:hypothetical protein VE25_16205 [Devosia geojensis]|uniref:DUF1697 domain-containing protein n=2 Tax=Devosia geojensis TaxID=443610 RepID=A0A0F5FPN2_9HYPH|nr:hypothetical protein VE25_16205 [Devosia geojensis]